MLGRSGSKFTAQGKIGTVVPMHDELKLGTLRSILKLAKVDPEEFSEFL
jgi:predicted RNA binding protein YcfA (HicA-like mRNA interferase family)